MGNTSERRLAALRQQGQPSATITRNVSRSQILDVAPDRRRPPAPPATLRDPFTAGFFAEGNRQELEGVFRETEHVRLRSLDRVPRRWWPLVLVWCMVLGAAAAGGWWLALEHAATILFFA